jgi:hypothetical protein
MLYYRSLFVAPHIFSPFKRDSLKYTWRNWKSEGSSNSQRGRMILCCAYVSWLVRPAYITLRCWQWGHFPYRPVSQKVLMSVTTVSPPPPSCVLPVARCSVFHIRPLQYRRGLRLGQSHVSGHRTPDRVRNSDGGCDPLVWWSVCVE